MSGRRGRRPLTEDERRAASRARFVRVMEAERELMHELNPRTDSEIVDEPRVFPSTAQIAARMGVSVRTVERILREHDELLDAGIRADTGREPAPRLRGASAPEDAYRERLILGHPDVPDAELGEELGLDVRQVRRIRSRARRLN